jgi:hypothetical protein
VGLEVQQLEKKLNSQFKDKIELRDVSRRPGEEQQQAFLTRSLVLFTLESLSGMPVSNRCILDDFNDNGIDGVLCDLGNAQLWLVQSKWIKSGNGEPGLGDTLKFVQGVKDLVECKFERFNTRLEFWKPQITELLQNPEVRINVVLSYTGNHFGEHSKRPIDDLLAEYNQINQVLAFHRLDLSALHKRLVIDIRGRSISEDIVLLEWGTVKEPIEAYYGSVCARDLYELWKKYGPALFASNLRDFVGSTEVNLGIQKTLLQSPDKFFYMNNGITILGKTVKRKLMGGHTSHTGIFQCEGVSIINGAQTVGCIGATTPENLDKLNEAKVLCRLISAGDEELAQTLTRASNTQNAILAKDFISADPVQKQLDIDFSLNNMKYVYRTGEELPSGIQGCTLDEATIALACKNADPVLAVVAKGNLSRLWMDRKRYNSIFPPSVGHKDVWRCVEVLRMVDEILRGLAVKNPEFRAVAVHGNRLVLHCLFQSIVKDIEKKSWQPDRKEMRILSTRICKLVQQCVNQDFKDSPLYSLFKNQSKAKAIQSTVMKHSGTIYQS